MKSTILFLFLLVNTCFAQTVVYWDNMESPPVWRGVSTTGANSSFIGGLSTAIDNPPNTPLFTSYDSCYRVKGNGLGSSTIELDTFVYPNVTLISGHRYQIRYKIASIGLNPTVQTAAGVDATDWIELQYSVNNGLSWWRDAQVQGISNSMWSFSGASGIMNNVVRTGTVGSITPTVYVSNPTYPVVNVWVTMPLTTFTQLKIRFITQINASGETFLLEDVQIVDLTPTLPVELLYFNAEILESNIKLKWATASETNNSRFEIYKSLDDINYQLIITIPGNGTTNYTNEYSILDDKQYGIIYYKLVQYDYDGNKEEFDPIAIQIKSKYKTNAIKIINILGQEVNENYEGYKMYIVK